MKRVAQLGALVVAALLCAAAGPHADTAARQPTPQRRRAIPSAAREAAATRQLFAQRCAKCHGADGRGDTPDGRVMAAPDFTDARWQERVSDARLVQSVTNGRDSMPPFKGKLSKQRINALVGHVRAFTK